jgi:hypothetical protein
LICAGVASPAVWKKYLLELSAYNAHRLNREKTRSISEINFRSKRYGWHAFGFSLSFSEQLININKQNNTNDEFHDKFEIENDLVMYYRQKSSIEHENVFMTGFLNKYFQRLSCHNCPVKQLKSGSDITLGDFWQIQKIIPEFDDDKGVSLVMINTHKGKYFYNKLNIESKETIWTNAITNKMIEQSSEISNKREIFFEKWKKWSVEDVIIDLTFYSILKSKCVFFIKSIIHPIIKFVFKVNK